MNKVTKQDLKRIAADLEQMDRAGISVRLPREEDWGDEHRAAIGDHKRALVAALGRELPRVGLHLPAGIGEEPVIGINRDIKSHIGHLATCGLLTPVGAMVARAFAEQVND